MLDIFKKIASSVKHLRVSFCSDTGSIRDDLYWNSKKNSLELIELSSTKKVNLVYFSFKPVTTMNQ